MGSNEEANRRLAEARRQRHKQGIDSEGDRYVPKKRPSTMDLYMIEQEEKRSAAEGEFYKAKRRQEQAQLKRELAEEQRMRDMGIGFWQFWTVPRVSVMFGMTWGLWSIEGWVVALCVLVATIGVTTLLNPKPRKKKKSKYFYGGE